VKKPFKHFGALKTGNGFGIAVDDLDPVETEQINDCLRELKTQIRGVKFHPKFYPRGKKMINAWTIPADLEALGPMLQIIDRFEFKRNISAERMIDQVMEADERRRVQRAENEKMSAAQDGPAVYIPHLKNTELRNYQRAAVDWVIRNRKVYIGDEMGTGKTICGLAAVLADGSLPLVVLCPASIKLGWKRQIDKFFPGLSEHVYICSGRKAKTIPNGTKIVIINYDIASQWVLHLQRFGYKAIILDEAHFIKNAKSKRSRTATVLAHGAEMRIAMSGTPLVSRPVDLVAQLNALGRLSDFNIPGSGKRSWSFIERYCRPTHNGYGWDISGSSNLLELSDNLRRFGILIRRRKEDVLLDLPPKERVSIPLNMANRREYNKIKNNIVIWIRQQINADEKFNEHLKTLSPNDARLEWEDRLSEKILKSQSAVAITKLSALRQLCMRGKIDAAIEWIDDFLTSGEKLVVFCIHREAVTRLTEHYGDAAVKIVGGMGQNGRQASIDAFIDNDDVKMVIANIDAAAEGIDGWQAVCSNVAFLELTWTPTKHHQAEDRCHRSGQQNPVTCYYLMASQSIDEYLAAMIEGKRAIVSAVVDREIIDRDDNILVDLMRRLAEGEF